MKKLYLFMLTVFAAIAANAETLTGTITDGTTTSATNVTAEATISDGVISFTKFLDVDFSFDVTCYSNGTAKSSLSQNTYSYEFNCGDFGTATKFWFYGGYDDFTYDAESKVLKLNVYANDGWTDLYDISFTLPDSFTAQEYVYAGEPYTITSTITSGADSYNYGTKYFEPTEVALSAYVKDNTITIERYLGGTSEITYTIADDGTVTGGVPAGYTYTDFTGGETHFYAISSYGNMAKFDAETRILTDEYYIYTDDNTYSYFTVSMPIPNFTDATATLNGSTSTFKVAYKLGDDGQVTLLQQFGSNVDVTYTIIENGNVSNDVSKAAYQSSTLGEIGAVTLYFSNDSYTTQSYAESDGTKTLSLSMWEYNSSLEASISVTLPSDFEPQELNYLGQPYTLTATITSGDDGYGYGTKYFEPTEVSMSALVEGNTVTLAKYLGGASYIAYTIADDGTVTGGVPAGYTSTDFTGGETHFYSISSYGNKAKFDAETRILTDEYYIYADDNTYSYFKVSVPIPTFTDATATASNGSSTFKVAYELDENGQITFPQLFGTTLSPTFTITESGSVSYSISADYYDGTLGELGTASIYLSANSYTTVSYASSNDVQTLSFSLWIGSSKGTIVITLPSDFEPQVLEKNVKLYAFDGESESGEAILAHLDVTIDGSNITIVNPFGSTNLSLPLTMVEDGTVQSTYTVGGYYTRNMSFNGTSYVRLFDNQRDYDVANNTFVWHMGFTTDSNVKEYASAERYVLYYQLPDDFTPLAGVKDITVDNSEAEVEYFNLQGIRVNNPTNGLYIRRQGKTVTKVLVK